MKKLSKCNLCESYEITDLFEGKDRMHNVNKSYSINKCNNCGLIFVNPQPNFKELAKHYPSKDYYSFKGKEPSAFANFFYKNYYSSKNNPIIKLFLSPIAFLFRSTKIIPNGKFLDIGCGSGEFLVLMKRLKMNPHGIEPGDFDTKFAKKHELKIKKGTLQKAKYPSNYFDVITLNHVFEHVDDPSKTLKELHRITKPGGTVIIGIPQTDNPLFKFFGKDWVQLDIPRHLFMFSTKNLKQYSKKIGFKIERTKYNSTPFQFIGTAFYFLSSRLNKQNFLSDKKTRKDKIFYNFLFLAFLPLSYFVNLMKRGDQIEIILRK